MIGKRNVYLDVVKGIAIFLVVWGHCIQYGTSESVNGAFFSNPCFMAIYSFHMPLFMLISGYLFYSSVSYYDFKKIVLTRVTRLLFPIFSWNVLFGIVLYTLPFFSDIPQQGILFYLKSCFIELWFLWAVFWSSLVVIVIKRIFNDNILLYFLSFIICLLLPWRFNFHVYTFVYPFFVIGYWTKKYEIINIFCKMSRVTKLLFFIVLFIIYAFLYGKFSIDSYVYISGVCILKSLRGHLYIDWSQLNIDMFRYIIGLIGSSLILLFLYIVMKVWNSPKNVCVQLFSFLGRRTLGIYAISSYLNVIILNNLSCRASFDSILAVPIESFLMLSISCLLIAIMERHTVLKKYFLGSR